MMLRLLLLSLAFITLIISGCAPISSLLQPDTRGNQVILLDAPTSDQALGLSRILERALEYDPISSSYHVIPAEQSRYYSTALHYGNDQEARNASIAARNLGAEAAVLISAPVYERDIHRRQDGKQLITTEVQVRAVIVDTRRERIVSRYISEVFGTRRIQPRYEELPEQDTDPDIQYLSALGIEQVRVRVATDLAAVLNAPYP